MHYFAKTNNDIIQIKRVISSASKAAQVDDERYYLITNMNAGEIFAGDAANRQWTTVRYGNISTIYITLKNTRKVILPFLP